MRVKHFFLFLYYILLTILAHAENKSAPNAFPISEPIQFEDGKDYFSYRIPININRNDDRILIQTFFAYDCYACSGAQDILALYSQLHSDDVHLQEHPVATDDARFSAQLYFTLVHLGLEGLSDKLLFETSDPARFKSLSQWDNLLNWLIQHQINIHLFQAVFDSSEIHDEVNAAIYRTQQYGVFTYPFVVIDGKYVLTESTLYNDDYTFAVLDFLVNKLKQEQQ